MKHVEGLRSLLQPSAAPQDRLDEIKRESVPGKSMWRAHDRHSSTDRLIAPICITNHHLHRIGRLDQIGGCPHYLG